MTRSQAKHIILKSMGFKSGKYKEAFNQITKNRARALTKRANEGSPEEIGMMKDMFLNKVDDGSGNQEAIPMFPVLMPQMKQASSLAIAVTATFRFLPFDISL